MQVLISRNPLNNQKYIHENIAKDLKAGRQVYYVVPEQFTLSTEQEIFRALNKKSIVDLKIKSFRSIINEVLTYTGLINANFLTDTSQKFIIKLVLESIKEDLKLYSKNIEDEGFIDLLMAFLKTLKGNLTRPSDLDLIINNLGESQLATKLKDIKIIYETYEKYLAKSKFDSNDKIDLAIENISRIQRYKETVFYFDQFNTMPKQEIQLMQEITKISPNVVTAVTIDKNAIKDRVNYRFNTTDSEIFQVSQSFIKELEGFIKPEYIFLDDNHENKQINLVLNNLFSYKPAPNANLDKIFLNRYKTTSEEVDALAINISKDIFEDGLRYKDIAVAVAEGNEYFNKIKRTFLINELPFFIDAKRNLLENPLAKYLKSALSLLSGNFATSDIINYLKQAFFQIDDYKLNIFQNYLEQRKIRGKMIFDDKYFALGDSFKEDTYKNRYKDEDIYNLDLVNEVRGVFLDSIEKYSDDYDFITNKNSKDNIKNHAQKIYSFVSATGILQKIKEYETWILDQNNLEISEENRLVWNSFVQILDDFVAVDPSVEISFQKFTKYLDAAIDQIEIGIVPPSIDQILVGDFNRSRFQQKKKIYILGLTDLYFPKAHTESDIFIDHEKNILKELGINIENMADFKNDKDIFALYNIISKVMENLSASYSLINSSNEAMGQAQIISRLEDMIDLNQNNLAGIDYKDYVYSKNIMSYKIPESIRRINASNEFDQEEFNFYTNLYKELDKNEKYNSIVEPVKLADRWLVPGKVISDKSLHALYKDGKTFSVSEIENFRKCAYKHFIDYGLRPRQVKSYKVDALDYGNIAHKTLESFVKKDVNIDDLNEFNQDFDQAFYQGVEEYIEEYKSEDARNSFFLDAFKKGLGVSAYEIKNKLNKSQPDRILTEVRYGKGGLFPEVNYKVDGKTYAMSGIIDRADEFYINGKKYYRIIDYKTNNTSFDLSKVYNGFSLQLLVYLYAVLSKDKDTSIIGGFYNRLNHKYLNILDGDLNKVYKEVHLLDGLVMDDFEALSQSDQTFKANAKENSEIIKFSGRSYDYNKKSNVYNKEIFGFLIERVNEFIVDSIRKINAGKIEAHPVKETNSTACDYCEYRHICKFNNIDFNYVPSISASEIKAMWEAENEWYSIIFWTRPGYKS